MSAPPLIALAFANNRDDHLTMLQRERKAIYDKLQRHHDAGFIQVHKEENTGIDDVLNLFTRYADRIALFHYGGHASGDSLLLETSTGEAQRANAVGLAQLLGQQKSLQLVFLNGCATRDQVALLHAQGVKAVIATAVPINDEAATVFAEHFYDKLASGGSIGEAFQHAQGAIALRYGQEKKVAQFRGVPDRPVETGGATSALTWGLYILGEGGDAALGWKLPEQAAREVRIDIRGAEFSAKTGAPANAVLTKALLEALLAAGKRFSEDAISNDGDHDEGYIRKEIIEYFPLPVGEQIRKVMTEEQINPKRLRELVLTYETAVKLLCYAMLSQLWDARHDHPDLKVDGDALAALRAFSVLPAEQAASFDHMTLILSLWTIFEANAIAPFMPELTGFVQKMQEEKLTKAHQYLEQMRAELRQDKVGAEEIAGFCVQTESQLALLLSELVFLGRYKLSSVKGIEFVKQRHKPPRYGHMMFMLDGAAATGLDKPITYTAFAESASVLMLKTLKDVTQHLNLTPFVIDENALTKSPKAKLFFYSHHDRAADSYHFSFVSDATQALQISATTYPDIKGQFEEFKKAMLPS